MNEVFAVVVLWIGISVWQAHKSFRLPIFSTFSCLFLIAAQFILIEQTFFGISCRILAFALAVLALYADITKHHGYLVLSRPAKIYAQMWLLFMASIFVSQLVNGAIFGWESVFDYFGRYGFALIAFLLVYRLATYNGGGHVITIFLFLIALVNLLAAIAQVGGYQQAYDLHDVLFPYARDREAQLQEEGLITTFGYTPGLSSYSVATGYVLTCFGLSGIGYSSTHSRPMRILILAITLIIILLGGILILSRSTMTIGVLCYILCILVLSRQIYRLLFLVAILSAFVIFLGAGPMFLANQDLLPGITRITSFQDDQRTVLWIRSLSAALDNPFFGGYNQAIESGKLTMGAHNFILNAFLYFGIFGLIPMLAVTLYPIYWGLLQIKLCIVKDVRINSIMLASLAGAVAYIIKSTVHNESIVTSGIQFCLLVGLMFGSAAELRFANRAVKM